MCAAVREQDGPDALARFYEALGEAVFEREVVPEHSGERERRGTHAFVLPCSSTSGCPPSSPSRSTTTRHDAMIQAETDEALALTGRDVGTPIIQIGPPDGLAFFGPVISRKPADDEAEQLWDHVVGLARFPGFAELKRSLRERPAAGGVRGGAGRGRAHRGLARREQAPALLEPGPPVAGRGPRRGGRRVSEVGDGM